eukprot:g3699.t1
MNENFLEAITDLNHPDPDVDLATAVLGEGAWSVHWFPVRFDDEPDELTDSHVVLTFDVHGVLKSTGRYERPRLSGDEPEWTNHPESQGPSVLGLSTRPSTRSAGEVPTEDTAHNEGELARTLGSGRLSPSHRGGSLALSDSLNSAGDEIHNALLRLSEDFPVVPHMQRINTGFYRLEGYGTFELSLARNSDKLLVKLDGWNRGVRGELVKFLQTLKVPEAESASSPRTVEGAKMISRVIPTQDGEMYWSQVFPKVPTPSAWELIVRLDPHVREEVEVGRLAHCIIFLARLGGYLSIVSGLLAFCWVQRYKVDKQTHLAQTLEELLNEETFVLDTLSPQHNDHFEPLTGYLVSINLKKKLEGRICLQLWRDSFASKATFRFCRRSGTNTFSFPGCHWKHFHLPSTNAALFWQVVGSINVDVTMEVARLPERHETLTASKPAVKLALGGKGANQAVAAARLGAAVRFVGRVGADAHGAWLLDVLNSNGVDTSGCTRSETLPSGQGMVMLDPEGGASSVVVGDQDWASFDLKSLDSLLEGSSVLLLQQEIPAEINLAAAQATTDLAHARVKNEKWKLFSWVVVIGLYAFPTLFYAMRIFEVWRTNAPLLQTSQSDDWGHVPELWFCSVEPLNIETCVLQSFRTVDGSEPNGSKGESLCQIISPPKKHEQQKIQLGTGKGFGDKLDEPKGQFDILPPQFKDQFKDSYCQAINATALKPSSPSRLFLGGDASKSFGLYYVMRDHCGDTCHHPIFLTRAFPGIAGLLLTKVRKGSMQLSADPYANATNRSFVDALKAFFSPQLYDAFSTQLLFVNGKVIPPQDGEMYWSQVFPKVPTPSAWELIVRLHPHVKEEVQVGRLAQCIIFLARLGGYLSIVSGLLAFCWVQRYKEREISQEFLELLDFVCPNEGELQRLTKQPTGTREEVLSAASTLFRRVSTPLSVLVTLGARGALLVSEAWRERTK